MARKNEHGWGADLSPALETLAEADRGQDYFFGSGKVSRTARATRPRSPSTGRSWTSALAKFTEQIPTMRVSPLLAGVPASADNVLNLLALVKMLSTGDRWDRHDRGDADGIEAPKGADDLMRCFIALGLNCGHYAMDIATLRPEHLAPAGYIARFRNKTGVPVKHQLWPLPQRLIERHRSDALGLLFTRRRRRDRSLGWSSANGKYDAIGTEFAKLALRVGVKASWSQLRDTSNHHVEKIGANGDGPSAHVA
jgi:hypothetical protein